MEIHDEMHNKYIFNGLLLTIFVKQYFLIVRNNRGKK